MIHQDLKTKSKSGFTLIEVSIVLVILAVLAGVLLSKMAQDSRRTKASDLQSRLDRIELALKTYAKQTGSLPCPSDATMRRDVDNNFGVATIPAGDCTNGASYSSGFSSAAAQAQAANQFDSASHVVGGSVPVRTLAAAGLTDDDMFDPWGNQIAYFVTRDATANLALANSPLTQSMGTIIVNDASGSGTPRTSTALVLILSYGANGHGAHQLSGAIKSASSTNADELQNCHCTSAAANGTFNNTFMLHISVTAPNPLNNYDDVGRYYLRSYYQ